MLRDWPSQEVCTALVATSIANDETAIEEVRCEVLDVEAMLHIENEQRQAAIAAWQEANPLMPLTPEEANEIPLQSSGCEVVDINPASPLAWLVLSGLLLRRRRQVQN